MSVTAGEFELIYDPSVGEDERWYINDHTIVRDHRGTWHLIGITHAEPAQPFDELHLAHATAASLHGPWTKQPSALSTDTSCGETHLRAPSEDPLAFDVEDQVGFIDAHASEVMVDEDGGTWISHCGWGQGGVHIAPLTWG